MSLVVQVLLVFAVLALACGIVAFVYWSCRRDEAYIRAQIAAERRSPAPAPEPPPNDWLALQARSVELFGDRQAQREDSRWPVRHAASSSTG